MTRGLLWTLLGIVAIGGLAGCAIHIINWTLGIVT